MPRRSRSVVPHVAHHVWLRGNNRRRLFSSFADRQLFLRCLRRGLRASNALLHQLTLMNNHVHMIAVPAGPDGLRVLVARTCQRYAQLRNQDREASGKLFEERYHSKVIEDAAALMTTTLYNDANGYRAGLAPSPFGYAWSTGPLHAGIAGGRIPRAMWTPSGWYVGLAADPAARAERYRELMMAYIARSEPRAADRDSPYTRRLERPDRSFAREPMQSWRWADDE